MYGLKAGIFLAIICTASLTQAQEVDSGFTIDSAQMLIVTDTSNIELLKEEKPHNPRLATLMSTLVPGLGQVYNRKYWKVPIVLGGMGMFAYFVQTNQQDHKKALASYETSNFTDQNAEALIEYHRKRLDQNVIGLVAIYLANIIDANIDAHLYHFDVSDDLSLNLDPDIQTEQYGINLCLAFTLNF